MPKFIMNLFYFKSLMDLSIILGNEKFEILIFQENENENR